MATNIKLLKIGFLYTIGDFLTLGITTLFLIPFYTKHLTPSEYGSLGIFTFYYTFLGILMMMGYHSVISRFFFLYKGEGLKTFISTLFISQTAFALIVTCIFILCKTSVWHLVSVDLPIEPYFLLLIGNSFFAFGSGVYSMWLRVSSKAFIFFIIQVLNAVLIFLFVFYFIGHKHLKVDGALTATLCSSAIMSIISFFGLRKVLRFRFDWSVFKHVYRFGFWIVLGTMCSMILNKYQLVIVEKFSTLYNAGILNLSLQIASLLTVLSVSFAKAWQPYVFENDSKLLAEQKISKAILPYTCGVFFVAIFFILSSRYIIIFMAPQYFEAIPIVKILILNTTLNTLSLFPATLLLFEKKAFLMQSAVIVTSVLSLFINYILIKLFLLTGVLIAYPAITLINLMLHVFFSTRVGRINCNYNRVLKVILISILSLLISYWVEDLSSEGFIIFLKFIILVSFPILLVVSGVFKISDIKEFWQSTKASLIYKDF